MINSVVQIDVLKITKNSQLGTERLLLVFVWVHHSLGGRRTQTTANMLNIHFEINHVNKQNHNTGTSVEYAAYPMTW
jgi:hypothetical protein